MTPASRIYHQHRIPEHGNRQCYAAMRVLMHLRATHSPAVLGRHEGRVIRILATQQEG